MTTQPSTIGDLLQHFAKAWPIKCAGEDTPLVKVGDTVTFSVSPNFAMIINGTTLTPTHIGLHSGDRMTEIDPILGCSMELKSLRGLAPTEALVTEDPEEFLQLGVRHYEHVTMIFEAPPSTAFVFAFVNIPDPNDPTKDTLVLAIKEVRDGHNVGENSVHGGPPG